MRFRVIIFAVLLLCLIAGCGSVRLDSVEDLNAEPSSAELTAAVPDTESDAEPVPAAAVYNARDCDLLAAFFDLTDKSVVSNGLKVDAAYDSLDPGTWGKAPAIWEIEWEEHDDGELHLKSLTLSAYEEPLEGTLDLSGCETLRSLACYSGVSSVRADNCPLLESISCSGMSLGDYSICGCPLLTDLCLNGCGLKSLNVRDCPSLEYLTLWRNELGAIDLSGLNNLVYLCLYENRITELDLSGAPGLEQLDVRANRLTKIDLSPCPGLVSFLCNQNDISALELSFSAKLKSLDCSWCRLDELDVSSCPELEYISISGMNIQELDFSHNPALQNVNIMDTKLTSLDLSGCGGLWNLKLVGNPVTDVDLTGCDSYGIYGIHAEGPGMIDIGADYTLNRLVITARGRQENFRGWFSQDGEPVSDSMEFSFERGEFESLTAVFSRG